jgi:uncharacterized membrane protein
MGLKIIGKDPAKAGADYSEHLAPGTPKGKAVATTATVEAVKTVLKGQNKGETTLIDQSLVLSPGVLIPADQMAIINVGGGQTISTGNYENVKFNVNISLPSHVNDIEETYEYASDWVSAKMTEIVASLKG